MATAMLKYELRCPICLDIYTCPVMLDCGHNFCRACIQQLIEQQTENLSCPECRRGCSPEDLMRVNFKLGNIAESYKSMQGSHSSNGLPCTYCIQSPDTAVKTCLHCEASFCWQHLDAHSKGKEHVLVEPTTSLQNRKCQIHNEIFKYFCINDQSCICASCCLTGEHQGHLFELLETVSLNEKEELKKGLESLKLELEFWKRRKNILHDYVNLKREKLLKVKEDLDTVYSNLHEHIVNTHVNMMYKVRQQLGKVSKHVLHEITSVEKRAAKLSQDLEHVQATCRKMDPLTVFQDKECKAIYYQMFSAQPDVDDRPASPAQDMDMLLISLMSQKSLESILHYLQYFLSRKLVCLKYNVSLLLNEASASNCLILSDDLKTVTYSKKKHLEKPWLHQFKTSQVLSISDFSSGKFFWEVETSKTGVKAVGVAYPTIERDGLNSYLGYNEKSWCLIWGHDYIEVCHNSSCKQIVSRGPTMRAVGVFLDYEAGKISFYRLCTRVEHLHTITTRFTEPLHAAFYLVDSWIKINPKKSHVNRI